MEECIKMLREKMARLRHLYSLQYKTLNHRLREERRRMLKDFDIDAHTMLKAGCEDFPSKRLHFSGKRGQGVTVPGSEFFDEI